MKFEDFEKEIDKYFCEMNLETTRNQKEKLYDFMKYLIEINEKVNLTAITEENEIILKHFVDSIIIQKYIQKDDNVIDIGTGAGFPGIPLKIIKEENKFLLIDSLNKRINFIKQVIEKIKLNKIEAVHGRAEELAQQDKYREQYDIAVSRAVSKLNILMEYMLPFVKKGGKCICLKGPNIKDELEEAKKAIEILGGKIDKTDEFTLPNSDIKRSIVIITKIKETPSKYPRKSGMPNSKPL